MSKGFKFKLDSVLKLRNQKVTEAKNELMVIANKMREKEREILDRRETLQNLIDSRDSRKKLEEIQAFYSHKDSLEYEIDRLKEEKENLSDIENLKREKLKNALKEEKVMENLKDRKKEEFLSKIKSEEGKELDEIGLRNSIKQRIND